jgi:tellurite resistance protein TehA-like permease
MSWFGLVMATGIVSIATREELSGAVSAALGVVAGAAWLVLLVLGGRRLIGTGERVRDELMGPTTWPAFFAFVAATDVVGARAAIAGWDAAGRALWALAALAWLALMVAVPMAMRARGGAPAWWAASGNWLLAVVATQSLAVLAGVLVAGGQARPLLPVAVACWALGVALYAALITVIGARVLSARPVPARFTPDDWIVMGALAISSLAATELVRAGERSGSLPPLAHAVLVGGGAITWAVASAAVAPLIVLHVRSLLRDQEARHYRVRWWAAVFPLGMYSVATHELAVAAGWDRLEPVARAASWIAVAAWTATAAAAMRAPFPSSRSPAGTGPSERRGT